LGVATRDVTLTSRAQKDLAKLAKSKSYVARKFQEWVESVKEMGLEEVRKTPGYHDEPCKGQRQGQRSIRLAKGYRAFYEIIEGGKVKIVEVQEINLHDY
jgi:proteic killer suppression protein